jgi:predicted lipid-binding transport protein (Tim44 family)
MRAAAATDMNPRLIIGPVIGEQMRFFTARRSSFKSYFGTEKVLVDVHGSRYVTQSHCPAAQEYYDFMDYLQEVKRRKKTAGARAVFNKAYLNKTE